MYVRDTDPLPPNSQTATGCASWASDLVASMNASIANAQAASASIAGPASFAQFGPAVVIDVARSQNDMAAASVPVSPVSPSLSVPSGMMAAPTVVPLNVTEEEYGGCCSRSAVGQPQRRVATPQVVTMPQRAPLPVTLPAQGATPQAPKYKNLCWALRNGAVDPSQFDPTEFQALQYRCSQQGYAGACVPPPLVALWLDQQRRAGTLPHISVPQTTLDAIPQAPDLTAVTCPQSWTMGGLAGRRRGMGAAWGDAGSLPSTASWPAPAQIGGVSLGWQLLLWAGVLGLGVYAVANR